MAIVNRTLIILTASVAPQVKIIRSDSETRLHDYMNALALWWKEFEHLPVDILFIENSGYNLSLMTDWVEMMNAGNRVRLYQFKADKSLIERLGKSAGEAEMFDVCFHSNLIYGYDYIMKSTGRLFVSNAKKLLENFILSDSDWSITVRSTLDFVDVRFFIVRLELYGSYLLDLGKEVNDMQLIYIEHAMFRRVSRAIADGHKWGQFRNLPRYEGIGASDGKHHTSIFGSLRYFIKNGLHRLGARLAIYWYL